MPHAVESIPLALVGGLALAGSLLAAGNPRGRFPDVEIIVGNYPAVNPAARFILIAPGIQGELSYSFRPGPSHYRFAFRKPCVTGNGPTYLKGEGTVFITQGAGHEFYPLQRPLSLYYAAAQDRETGFVRYTISPTTIAGAFVSTSGVYADRFEIVGATAKAP